MGVKRIFLMRATAWLFTLAIFLLLQDLVARNVITQPSDSVSADSTSANLPLSPLDSLSETEAPISGDSLEAVTYSSVVLMADKLTSDVRKIQADVQQDYDISSYRAPLREKQRVIDIISDQLDTQNYRQLKRSALQDRRNKLNDLRAFFNSWQNQLLDKIDELNEDREVIIEGIFELNEGRQQLLELYGRTLPDDQLSMLRTRVIELRDQIDTKLQQIIAFQTKVELELVRVNDMLFNIDQYLEEYDELLKVKNEPFLFSKDAWRYQASAQGIFHSLMQYFFKPIRTYLATQLQYILAHVLFTLGLIYFLYFVHQKKYADAIAEKDPLVVRGKRYISHYILSGLIVSLTLTQWIAPNAPSAYLAMVFMLNLLTLAILLYLTDDRVNRRSIIALSLLYYLTLLLSYVPELTTSSRIFLLVIHLATVAAFGVLLLPKEKQEIQIPNVIKVLLYFLLVSALVAIGLNVAGYVRMASLLQQIILEALILAILLRVFVEIIYTLTGIPAVARGASQNVFTTHGQQILSTVRQVLILGASVFWVVFIFKGLLIYDPVYEAISEIINEEREIGSFTFSLSGVLLFAFIIFATFFISGLLRLFFEVDMFQKIRKGNKITGTIVFILRYILIIAGFFIAMAASGFNITNIAIILGALGVGIGFGLQDMVNNLLSGFILAFERPVRIGDIIEFEGEFGEVKEIGMRSSRMKTYSGAEIVIPNGILVSNRIVNWTLSNSHRRIDLRLGVAYGSPVKKVKELISQSLENTQGILKKPPPMVLFKEFGDSSLNFRVLFWVSLNDNWLVTESELLDLILDEFNNADIVIPFPQRDLHIKSGLPGNLPGKKARAKTKPGPKNEEKKS